MQVCRFTFGVACSTHGADGLALCYVLPYAHMNLIEVSIVSGPAMSCRPEPDRLTAHFFSCGGSDDAVAYCYHGCSFFCIYVNPFVRTPAIAVIAKEATHFRFFTTHGVCQRAGA